MRTDNKHTLYRHFDKDGRLLYVGISCRWPDRVQGHKQCSDWWYEVASIKMEHFLTRDAALRAEHEAITREHPQWNIQYNYKTDYVPETNLTFGEIDGRRMVADLVRLKPLYRVREAAEAVGVSTMNLRKAIDRRELNTALMRNTRDTAWVEMVTGWQLLAWIEGMVQQKGD